tara:strand:- start:1306 stop:1944 length:639 start_codon:yes stop_codon:yes gene_type:complete
LKILVITPHPDDEVIGMGGTIKKLGKTNHIELLVISEGATSQYSDKNMIKVRHNACLRSSKLLGIRNVTFLDFPDMQLDTIPHIKLNKSIEKFLSKFKPEVVYTSPNHDLNLDHQKVFESTLVATRPISSSVKKLFTYELPGFTRTPYNPNTFVDISKYFETKIKAFKFYKSEINPFPHPRSIKSLENLAVYRGIQSGLKKAEAFELIRKID